jgi:DNA-binding HxlR family transcriptional regulator
VRANGFGEMVCSAASVMEALEDRWGALIMRDLILGLTRYEDLRKSSSVTNATLTARLRSLEANGLIERRQYQSRPDRYEYHPTAKGRDIRLVLQAMMQVGDRWNGGAENAPLSAIDRRTGHRVALALVDLETGNRVEGGDIAIVAGPGADEIGRWRLDAGVTSRLK